MIIHCSTIVVTMGCNAFFVAVMLPVSWAVANGEYTANAVNVISGISAEIEYCLIVQGFSIIESMRVCGGK